MPHTPDSDAWRKLVASDYRLCRIVEDVIDALIAKGAVKVTDLPQAAQDVLSTRKALRQQ